MSTLYGTMEGMRGTVSRTGSKDSGMISHLRGWDDGVKTTLYYNPAGRLCARVEITGGSHNTGARKTIYDKPIDQRRRKA